MRTIVSGIVLAAGRSRRMGRPKAVLPIGPGGETFVGRIIRILREGGVDDVVVVVAGEESPVARARLREELAHRIAVNPSPDLGQLSSVKAGLHAVDRPGVGGMLVTLVDVPLVSAATVRALLAAHDATRAPVVRPVRGGRHGHPVVFARSVFDELRRATVSAKEVVTAHLREAVAIPIAEDGPFRDIDTPADYEAVFGRPPPDVPDFAGEAVDRPPRKT